jgi:hypothetical protein
MMNPNKTICDWCGEEVTDYTDIGGKAICSECNGDGDDESQCCLCGEYQPNEFFGGIGSLMAVVNDEADVPEGIYEILERPFYASNHLSMWLYKEAVKKLGDSTFDLDTDGFAIGFFCPECCAEVRQQLGNPVEELC